MPAAYMGGAERDRLAAPGISIRHGRGRFAQCASIAIGFDARGAVAIRLPDTVTWRGSIHRLFGCAPGIIRPRDGDGLFGLAPEGYQHPHTRAVG